MTTLLTKIKPYIYPFFIILLGLSMIFYKSIRNSFIATQINKYQISHISKSRIKSNQLKTASYDYSSINHLSLSSIVQSESQSSELNVIGGIAIPELEINLPIFKGLGNAELSLGSGTMKSDQKLGVGNYALASHHVFGIDGSSTMLFSPLERATKGMTIYLTDKDYIYTYIVSNVTTVDPTEIEVVEDKEGVTEVTLITCTDEQASQRIVVKGNYQSKVSYEKASTEMKQAFQLEYNQLQK